MENSSTITQLKQTSNIVPTSPVAYRDTPLQSRDSGTSVEPFIIPASWLAPFDANSLPKQVGTPELSAYDDNRDRENMLKLNSFMNDVIAGRMTVTQIEQSALFQNLPSETQKKMLLDLASTDKAPDDDGDDDDEDSDRIPVELLLESSAAAAAALILAAHHHRHHHKSPRTKEELEKARREAKEAKEDSEKAKEEAEKKKKAADEAKKKEAEAKEKAEKAKEAEEEAKRNATTAEEKKAASEAGEARARADAEHRTAAGEAKVKVADAAGADEKAAKAVKTAAKLEKAASAEHDLGALRDLAHLAKLSVVGAAIGFAAWRAIKVGLVYYTAPAGEAAEVTREKMYNVATATLVSPDATAQIREGHYLDAAKTVGHDIADWAKEEANSLDHFVRVHPHPLEEALADYKWFIGKYNDDKTRVEAQNILQKAFVDMGLVIPTTEEDKRILNAALTTGSSPEAADLMKKVGLTLASDPGVVRPAQKLIEEAQSAPAPAPRPHGTRNLKPDLVAPTPPSRQAAPALTTALNEGD